MTYLVDSDWLIDALADRGAALDVLEALLDQGVAVSLVSLGEIYEGIVGKPAEEQNVAAVRRFLDRYEVLGLTEAVMLAYARVRKELRLRGQRLEDTDLLIAATALADDRILITRNRRHFDRVPGLRIY